MHLNICDDCKMSCPWWLSNNLANSFDATRDSLTPSEVVDRICEEILNNFRRENKAFLTRYPTPSPGKTSRKSRSTLVGLLDSKETQCNVMG